VARERLEEKQLIVEKIESIISFQEYAAKNAEANITEAKNKRKWGVF